MSNKDLEQQLYDALIQQFLNKLGYKNIKSKLYPDLRHEILNEKEYEQIYEDVLEFFKQ